MKHLHCLLVKKCHQNSALSICYLTGVYVHISSWLNSSSIPKGEFWWFPKWQLVGWSQLLRLKMLSRHVFCFHICPLHGVFWNQQLSKWSNISYSDLFKGKHWDQLLWINDVWRIIPVSKWLENPWLLTTWHLEIYSWRKLLFYLGRSVQDGLPYVHQ